MLSKEGATCGNRSTLSRRWKWGLRPVRPGPCVVSCPEVAFTGLRGRTRPPRLASAPVLASVGTWPGGLRGRAVVPGQQGWTAGGIHFLRQKTGWAGHARGSDLTASPKTKVLCPPVFCHGLPAPHFTVARWPLVWASRPGSEKEGPREGTPFTCPGPGTVLAT